MNWKRRVFRDFQLYAVTDLKDGRRESEFLLKIEQAYRGGVDIVQLRSKTLNDAPLLRLGRKIRTIADRYYKLFFINDRVDLAILTGADGVHLGQADLPVSAARSMIRRLRRRIWIGKSTHSMRQAIQAEKEKADYLGVGPVYSTPTKPAADPVGLKLLGRVHQRIQVPWVAIGGIDLANLGSVMGAGATRIAVVRAIFAANNPEKAAQQFKNILKDPLCLKNLI